MSFQGHPVTFTFQGHPFIVTLQFLSRLLLSSYFSQHFQFDRDEDVIVCNMMKIIPLKVILQLLYLNLVQAVPQSKSFSYFNGKML